MSVKPIPDGYPVVAPYLMLKGSQRFIDFMVAVFGARISEQLTNADGSPGHTEIRIGDSLIMLSEVKAGGKSTPVMLHVYVADVDATFKRAVAAGGQVVAEPADQFYGDRSGGVLEPAGNTLWIATHIEDVPAEEIRRRARNR